MIKNKTCCFIGQRMIDPQEIPMLRRHLADEIMYQIYQGARVFLVGGAPGFDTMAAQAVLKLSAEFPRIRLILVLPCRDQIGNWGEADIEKYNRILKQADEVVFLSEHYYGNCAQKRDRYLVENSRICICYMTKAAGSTAYTVQYAEALGLPVVNLAD